MNRLPDDALIQVAARIPDLWQQDAVNALRAGKDVIVAAPTGAGKTRIFELFSDDGRRPLDSQAVYTVPTRALANEKYAEWKAAGWPVGIATGDLAIDTRAPFLVATLETQRERILRGDGPGLLVIDEYQMLSHPVRGLNYELAIALASPRTQLLLLSGSVGNPKAISEWLERLDRQPELIRITERPVPLDDVMPDSLPQAPSSVSGQWPRLAARALLADLGPILIFAPRRSDAEKIARKIANTLPPDPPVSSESMRNFQTDSATEYLLSRRVGCHHSGLPYKLRAGLIEPLAKSGQLRVVVATMGLAAGINFSVRSVIVTGTRYFDGPFERELRPDELLQMFGRAGRRGIDEIGYVLLARGCPRIADGAPAVLRRRDEVDWPALFRVMAGARDDLSPFAAARLFCERLFTRVPIDLGMEVATAASTEASGEERFGPMREEFLNSEGNWEPAADARAANHPISNLFSLRNEKWIPALRNPDLVRGAGPGSVMKAREGRRTIYRKDLPILRKVAEDQFEPLPWVRKQLGLSRNDRFSTTSAEASIVPLLNESLTPLKVIALHLRSSQLHAEVDVGGTRSDAIRDSKGRWLIDPPRRMATLPQATNYEDREGGSFEPRPGTPAHLWRALGLLEANGHPTERGRIFSLFSNGEGLMIAAALEEDRYPIIELVQHLANIRAGHRFADRPGASEALATAARSRYGHREIPGYLRDGLSPAYGEGAAETIDLYLQTGRVSPLPGGVELSTGDIERAILEWMSLLRHILAAPELPVSRWIALREAAREILPSLEARASTKRLVDRLLPPQTKPRRLRIAGNQLIV